VRGCHRWRGARGTTGGGGWCYWWLLVALEVAVWLAVYGRG